MTIKKTIFRGFLCFLFLAFYSPKANALSFAEFIYQNAKINNLSPIKSYLSRGYYIDATDSSGMTALCYAIELKDFEAYKRIKSLGANQNHPCTKRTSEETTEHYAKRVAPVEQERIQRKAKASISSNKSYIGAGLLATGGAIALLAGSGGGGGGGGKSSSDNNKNNNELTCPDGYGAIDGVCQKIPTETKCKEGEQLVNGVCEKITCDEGYHLVGTTCLPDAGQSDNLEYINGAYVSSGNQNIINKDNSDVFGMYSNGTKVYNLYSEFSHPDDNKEINIENLGHGKVVGIYSEGHATNAFVDGVKEIITDENLRDLDNGEKNPIPDGSGKIKIKNYGNGDVYGIYSRILDAQNSWEASNAFSIDRGISRSIIDIENQGQGKTVGIWGDDRAYNAYSLNQGSAYGDINIKAKGDIIGIGGYMAIMNAGSAQRASGVEVNSNININSTGDGTIYGIQIQKDNKDIESDVQQWFAINAAGNENDDVKGTINIKNQGNGNVYGMYGGQQLYNAFFYGYWAPSITSNITGIINIENHGNGDVYGMYMPEADTIGRIRNESFDGDIRPDGTIAQIRSTISLTNTGDGITTGMRGSQYNIIENSGTININNLGSGTAIGIYGEEYSNIINSGTINITRQAYTDKDTNQTYTPKTKIGGTAYGIYAKANAMVNNTGTITIENAASGAGIYLEEGASLNNEGTIIFNGASQSPITGSALNIYNEPPKATTNPSTITDLNSMGKGQFLLNNKGKYVADILKGNLGVSSSTVKGSFDNTYTISSALHASDISNLNLYSKSAMFETSTKKNENTGTDVVLTRKSFDNFTKNQSVAKFLDKNYQEKQNLALYDDLKTAQSSKELSNKINNTTANDIIPTFRRQNALIQRSISKTFDDNLFNAPEQNYIAGYKYIDISNNPDNQIEESKGTAHTAYGLLKNKTSSNLTYGIGANITKLKSDYDNNSKRTANQFGLWLPLGYEFNNNLKWYSKLSAIYSDASYDRHTNFGVKSADYNEYQINLDNSVRYTIDLNSTTSLTPLLELNYTKYLSDSINEGSSNNALKIESSSADSLELGLGALLNKDFNFNQNQTLNIKIGGIYYVELLNPDKSLKANLNGNIGQFNIHSKQDKTRSVMTLKAKYDYNKALSIYGNIEKELNNDKSLLIDLGLQYNI